MGLQGFADVCSDGTLVNAEFGTTNLYFGSTLVVLPEWGLFTRAVSGLSTQFAIVKGHDSAQGYAYIANAAGTVVQLGTGTYGNYCVALQITGSQVRAVWVADQTTYYDQLFDAALTPAGAAMVHAIPVQFTGTSQGFLDLNANGTPIWTDSRRTLIVKGFPLVYPVERNGYWFGQGGGTLPAQILGVSPTGQPFTVYFGQAYEPHAAIGAGGAIYIAMRTTVDGAVKITIPPLPTFQGSVDGGSGGTAANGGVTSGQSVVPPLQHPVVGDSGLMTRPWAIREQNLSQAIGAIQVQLSAGQAQAGIVPAVPNVPPPPAGPVTLTGDVTGSGTSTIATTLASTAVTPGSYTSANVTVDAKGRITAAASGGGSGTVTHTAGALTVNQLVIGNAAADLKVLGTLGTTTTLLHGNAAGAPTFAAVSLTADVSGDLPLSSLAQASAASVLLGRGSAAGAGDFQEVTLGSGMAMTGQVLSATGAGGTVTTTGSPASGNLTKFSGASTITNGDLSGDVTTSGTLAATVKANLKIASIVFVIDGGGSAITTGVKGFLQIPFDCTITANTVLSTDSAATSGSIVIDVWKDTYANYPPTVADTITASAKPTLSSAIKSTDSTLTGWTTSVTAGDVLGFNVDSATTVTRVTLHLKVTRT